jgi:hypothetical protein
MTVDGSISVIFFFGSVWFISNYPVIPPHPHKGYISDTLNLLKAEAWAELELRKAISERHLGSWKVAAVNNGQSSALNRVCAGVYSNAVHVFPKCVLLFCIPHCSDVDHCRYEYTVAQLVYHNGAAHSCTPPRFVTLRRCTYSYR